MKNLRRVLCVVFALVMVIVFACACGNSGGGQQGGGESAPGGEGGQDQTTEAAGGVNDGTGSVLRVAMECGYAPYNWTQESDANGAVPIVGSSDYAYGYDVMMAKYIAEQLGMELEIYKLDWDSLPMAVQSGAVDCVIAGQSITAERLETIDFSEPYYYASIVTLTLKDSPYANATSIADFAGAKATSQLNTVWYDVCLPQIPDVQQETAQETAPQMLTALEAGAVDIVVTDQPTAMGACAVYPDMVMLEFTGTDGDFVVSEEEINIGISMQKGNTGLCNAINGVLATLTTDDFADWMNQAIAVQPMNEE
ncbi:MAG: transporter substrate-binding domain-containing protein [Lachnospiraceae bacterium]|nr:transporter substrate-binding domain-containing protein [Lachnospiraceae bacterium]